MEDKERQALVAAAAANIGTKLPMGASGVVRESDNGSQGNRALVPKGKAKGKGKAAAKVAAAKVAAAKVRRPKGIDFGRLSPRDFFREDGMAFNMGHDARLSGMLKRIAKGVATPDERRLALHPEILEHPKVVFSKHFAELVQAAKRGKIAKGFAKPVVASMGDFTSPEAEAMAAAKAAEADLS